MGYKINLSYWNIINCIILLWNKFAISNRKLRMCMFRKVLYLKIVTFDTREGKNKIDCRILGRCKHWRWLMNALKKKTYDTCTDVSSHRPVFKVTHEERINYIFMSLLILKTNFVVMDHILSYFAIVNEVLNRPIDCTTQWLTDRHQRGR